MNRVHVYLQYYSNIREVSKVCTVGNLMKSEIMSRAVGMIVNARAGTSGVKIVACPSFASYGLAGVANTGPQIKVPYSSANLGTGTLKL